MKMALTGGKVVWLFWEVGEGLFFLVLDSYFIAAFLCNIINSKINSYIKRATFTCAMAVTVNFAVCKDQRFSLCMRVLLVSPMVVHIKGPIKISSFKLPYKHVQQYNTFILLWHVVGRVSGRGFKENISNPAEWHRVLVLVYLFIHLFIFFTALKSSNTTL